MFNARCFGARVFAARCFRGTPAETAPLEINPALVLDNLFIRRRKLTNIEDRIRLLPEDLT